MPTWLIITLVLLVLFVGIPALGRWIDSKRIGNWETHAVCKCGWWMKPAFGDAFFVRPEICPKCAAPRSSFKMITRRWNGPMDDWEEKK